MREVESQDPATSLKAAEESAVARERARMARELHDGLATDLAGAISLFKVYLEGHRGDASDTTLINIFEILERMLKQVRETLAELRPRPIGPEGLVGDLRHQAEEFARLYAIRVEIASSGTEDMLPPPQREVVNQVVREALTNVRKHSGSSICRGSGGPRPCGRSNPTRGSIPSPHAYRYPVRRSLVQLSLHRAHQRIRLDLTCFDRPGDLLA